MTVLLPLSATLQRGPQHRQLSGLWRAEHVRRRHLVGCRRGPASAGCRCTLLWSRRQRASPADRPRLDPPRPSGCPPVAALRFHHPAQLLDDPPKLSLADDLPCPGRVGDLARDQQAPVQRLRTLWGGAISCTSISRSFTLAAGCGRVRPRTADLHLAIARRAIGPNRRGVVRRGGEAPMQRRVTWFSPEMKQTDRGAAQELPFVSSDRRYAVA
jgi:hypothetical protein